MATQLTKINSWNSSHFA